MSLRLLGHPFSSYCQKVLIALYENATPFRFETIGGDGPGTAEFVARWPLRRMPVLIDGETTVVESTIIIEHLALDHPGPVSLLPEDRRAALAVRRMDRIFDLYVMTPMQRIVLDALRPVEERDARTVAEAKALLDTAYAWLDSAIAGGPWAVGDAFTLADCAAAPALFYADWVQPIAAELSSLRAYRRRLLARPSFARCVEEARPFRGFFPLGAPDRD